MKYKLIYNISKISLFVTALIFGPITNVSAEQPATMSDGAIIAIYNQVNTFDIETAGLAIAHAKNSRVVGLAKMVQKDHTAVRQLAADLAIKLGEARTLPSSRAQATSQHAKVLTFLNSKNGARFDKAYLQHEIKFHTAAISAVNTVLIPATKSTELRELMKKILPGFEHHLAETKKIYKELGYYQ